MFKKLFLWLLFAALCVPWATQAQSLSDYQLSVDTTTFTSIASTGTAMSFSSADDGYASVQLPFQLSYGEDVLPSGTSLACSANGFIWLDASTASGTTATYSGSHRSICALLDQDGHMGRNTGAAAYYYYDATAGTFTIEYHLLGRYSSPYGAYSYQVVFHTNGNIEIVYDSVNIDGGSPSLATYLVNAADDIIFLTGAWATPSIATTYATRPTTDLPVHGLRYTLTRPFITCHRPMAISVDPSAEQIDFSWIPVGQVSNWMVMVASATDTDYYYTTDTFYTASNLTSNTPYTIGVRAICGAGDTSSYRMVDCTTSCMALTQLPYFNDFENEPYYLSGTTTYAEAFPSCWTRINDASGTYNYYPYITTTGSYLINGAKSLYWYHSTSSTYANNEYAVLPPVDPSVYDISDLTLSFYAKTTATAAPWPLFIVGVMSNVNDTSTFVPVDTITLTQTATLYYVNFDSYTGNGTYVAIRCPRPTTSRYCSLDDVLLTDDWCNPPTDVTATATSDAVTVSWNANGGTSFTVYLGSDTISNVLDTFYTFNNLSANTEYVYGVANECSSSISTFVSSDIRTLCTALSDLPYFNDFEDEPYYLSGTTTYAQAFPSCWTRINDASGTYNYYPYITTTGSYLINGAKSMYWYHSTSSSYANNEYVVLPPVDLSAYDISDLTLSFYAKTTATSAPWPMFIVGVMTSPDSVDSFVPVDTITLTSTAELYDVDFADYSGDGAYVAIRSPRTSSARYFCLDDVTLRVTPTCFWPSEVTASGITPDAATINWVPDERTSSPSAWNVEYGLHGFTPGEGDNETVYDTTISLYNLVANTEYDVYVYADCGGEVSDPTFLTFRTACNPLDSLPFTQTFEEAATGSGSNAAFVNCMYRLNNGTQFFGYPYVSSSSSYNITPSGNKGLYWYNSTTATTYGDYQIVVMPGVDTNIYPINTLQLSFWARATSTSYSPSFQVGVMSDPTDASTFSPVSTVNVGGNTSYTKFTVLLNNYTGNGQYVAIRAQRPAAAWYATVDDITLELMPNCPAVVDLNAVATAGSALLTWNYQDGYDAPTTYKVAYDTIGGNNPTIVTTSDPFYTISGLQMRSTYKAVVSADCGNDGIGIADSVVFSTGPFSTVTIDGGNTTTYYLPVGNFYNYSYTQQLIPANEMNGAAALTGIDFEYAHTSAMTSKTDVSIYLAHVTETSLASGFVPYNNNTFKLVYTGSLNCTQGWNHFQFDTVFNYDGTSNLLVVVHDNSGDYDGQEYTFYAHSATDMGRYVQNDGNAYTLTSISGGASTDYRCNMVIHFADSGANVSCAAPAVAVTNIDATSVDISWIPGYDETSWNIDYRPVGATTWTNDATSVSATSHSITGLNDGTEYEFRVSFLCLDDNTLYSDVVTATTNCMPKAVPYTMNFDTLTTGTATTNLTVMPDCWDYILTGTSTYQGAAYRPGVYYSANYANSGNYCLRLYGVGYFMLPEMAASLDSLRITFTDTITSTSYNGLVVGVMENGIFIPYDTVNLEVHQRNFVEVKFNNYHGPSRTIALQNFYATSSSVYYSYQYIDDIEVSYIPACEHVDNLMVSDMSDSSLNLSWTPAGEESEWMVIYGNNNVVVNDTALYISGLTPSTDYTFEVRSICGPGDTSESAVLQVTTPCAAMSLPYMENFESYSTGSTQPISSCWVKGTNSSTAYPYPYSYNAVNGNLSLYFYAYRPSTTTATSYYSYAALPMFTAPVDTLQVSFSMRRYSTTTEYYTSRIVVGVMTDPNDIATFSPVDTIDLHDEASLSIHNFEVNLNTYTGNGKFIAFYNEVPPLYGSSTYSYSYVYLDDIYVDYIPSCRRVTDVTVSNATETTANVSWTDPNNALNGYEIEYGPEGFTLGTGTTVTTMMNSITLTGLSSSSGYDVYVRALCSTDDNSPWSFPSNFRTVCGIYSVPFTEDFESYGTGSTSTIDPCWVKGTNYTSSSYPYPYTSAAINGQRGLYFYAYQPSTPTSTAYYSYVALPEFNIGVDSLELSFKMKRYATTNNTYTSRVLVGVMSDPSDITTFVCVDTIDMFADAGGAIRDVAVTFGGYTGNGRHLAIYNAVPPLYGTGTYSYSYVYIDDINVNIASPCGRPYDLQAPQVTNNSITLDWTDTIGATQWQIEYGPAGFELGTGTIVNATQKPYTITGLTVNTHYDIYVRSYCSNGTLGGTNNGIFTVSTSQVPATLPYVYNFEDATEWSNWQMVSNNNVNWYRGTAEAAEGNYSLYLSADSGATCNSLHNVITNAAVYRDIDFGPDTSSFEITFLAKAGGISDGYYEGINVMLADPAQPVETSSTALASPWGPLSVVHVAQDTNWNSYTMLFDNVSGVKRLVFNWFTSTTASHPILPGAGAIDSIAVAEQTCVRPLNNTITNIGSDFVSMHWEGDPTSNYIVRVREVDATTYTDHVATSTSITVTGLTPMTTYNAWVFRVCGENNYSYSAPIVEFTTTCAPFDAVDTLFEDFESVTGTAYSAAGSLPDCWEGYSNGTNEIYMPHVTGGSTYSYSITGNSVTLTSGSSTYGDTKILRLPKFNEPLNTLTMSYWYCTESPTNGTLYVGYMTGLNYETDFVPLVARPASSQSVHSGDGAQTAGHGVFDTVSFDSVPANALFIAFKWYYNTSYYSCCIDNVEVTSTGNYCRMPEASVSDISFDEATLNIFGSVSEDFEVSVKPVTTAIWPDAVAINTNTYTFTDLTPSTQYQFRVRALCDTAQGLISDWTLGNFTTDSLPCFDPSNMQVMDVAMNTATFDWTANGEETAWRIHVWNTNFDQTYDVTTHPATITGLAKNTQYNAAVMAICSDIFESGASDTVTFTTLDCPVPTDVAVSGVTTHSATINWNGTAASYTLEYGSEGYPQGDGTTIANVTGNSYELTDLIDGYAYDVYVMANCDAQNSSDWSAKATFTTLVGINGVQGSMVTLYPNPTSNSTTITLSGVNGDVTIAIVDMNGRTVRSETMNCEGDCAKTMQVDDLAQGAYFVRISGDNVNMVKKLVVK